MLLIHRTCCRAAMHRDVTKLCNDCLLSRVLFYSNDYGRQKKQHFARKLRAEYDGRMADNNNNQPNKPLGYDTRKRYEKARIEKVHLKKAVPPKRRAIHPLRTA